MAVRDWSGWHIAALWLAWAGVIAVASRSGRIQPAGASDGFDHTLSFAPSSAPHGLSDSQAVVLYSILAPLAADTRPDTSRQAALLRLLDDTVPASRDSLWHALGLPAKLSPLQRHSLPALAFAPIGKALQAISFGNQHADSGLWVWLLGIVTLTVCVPIILGIITLRWYVPRVIAKAAQQRAV